MSANSEMFIDIPPPKPLLEESNGLSEIITSFANIGRGTLNNRHMTNSKQAVKALMTMVRKENNHLSGDIEIIYKDVCEINNKINILTQIINSTTEYRRVYIIDIDEKFKCIKDVQLEHAKILSEHVNNKKYKAIRQYIIIILLGVLAFYMNKLMIAVNN